MDDCRKDGGWTVLDGRTLSRVGPGPSQVLALSLEGAAVAQASSMLRVELQLYSAGRSLNFSLGV